MAKAARPEVTPSTTSTPPRKPASKTKKPAGTRSTRVTKLSVDEINHARTVAPPYDRTRSYLASQWVIHPTFGVGRIEEVVDAGMINVRFEDGQTRKLIHGR